MRFEVFGDLARRVIGEALAHKRGDAGDVRRRLSRAEPRAGGCRIRAVNAHQVGLNAPVRGWAAPASGIYFVGCLPERRSHGQHAGVGAFAGRADAAAQRVMARLFVAQRHKLQPFGRRAALLVNG